MYPNPKTRKGQAWYQIFNAITVGTTIFYPLFLIIAPLAPQTTSSGGFLDFSPSLVSLFLAVLTFPLFTAIMGILFSIRQFICVKTNKSGKDNSKIVNMLYIAIFILSLVSAFLYILYCTEKSDLFTFVIILCLIILVLFTTALITQKYIIKKCGIIGIIKPVFEINIYKKPIFAIAVILFAVFLLSLPASNERASFEYDPNEYIYDRTNSFTYSYIKVEDRQTHEQVDSKLVIFPFNYQDTSELFDLTQNR